jgi:signal peptidase I
MPGNNIDKDEFAALAKEILLSGHSFRYRARGFSMRPFILNDDVVEIQPVDPDDVRHGDMILCIPRADRLVLHRVIHISTRAGKQVFITQGDACAAQDEPVGSDQILGRAVEMERNGRRIPLDSWIFRCLMTGWRWLAPVRPLLLRLGYFVRRIVSIFHAPRIQKNNDPI